MKDFRDLWKIAQTLTFEFANLEDAIQQTFERRRVSLPDQFPVGLGDCLAFESGLLGPGGRPSRHAADSKQHPLHSFSFRTLSR